MTQQHGDNSKDNQTPLPPAENVYELAPADPPVAPLAKGRVVERSTAKIGDASLIDDFDEDADFTRDPGVDRAMGKVKSDVSKVTGSLPTTGDAFVKPGWGTTDHIQIAAASVVIAAMIAAGVTAATRGRVWYADCLLTLYLTLLHTLTGAAAVMATAHLSEKRLGDLPLATARMGLAVAVFQLIWHINITAIPSRIDETLLAALGYVGVVWSLFRFSREKLMLVIGLHGALWFSVYFAAQLWVWSLARAAAAAVPVVVPAS